MSDSPAHRGAANDFDAAQKFVQKWSGVELSERATSHEHFIDLGALIGHPTPAQADPTGSEFTFEKPVKVTAAALKGSKGDGTRFVGLWSAAASPWNTSARTSTRLSTRLTASSTKYGDDLDSLSMPVIGLANPPLTSV